MIYCTTKIVLSTINVTFVSRKIRGCLIFARHIREIPFRICFLHPFIDKAMPVRQERTRKETGKKPIKSLIKREREY